jgi:hypothetical protein
MRLQAEMMANYKANVTSVSRIVEANGVPFLQRGDGVVVGLFPLDYVAWTRSLWQKEKVVSEALSRLQGVAGKELWIEGMVDPVTRKALEDRDWKVEDSVGEKLIKK